jgi:hypothetical protein
VAAFTTNQGNQKITYRFKQRVKANEFNTLLREGIEPGIYEGLNITHSGVGTPYHITISPGTLYIKATDASNNKLVRIQTQAGIDIVPGALADDINYYVIAHMEWYDQILNYCEFKITTVAPTTYEVLLGMVRFTAAGTLFHAGYPRTDVDARYAGLNKAEAIGDPATLVTTVKTLAGGINDLADGGTY